MIYPKSHTKELDREVFENPTNEYRAAPFWGWNCELDKDMLLRQIDCLKEMGFGGFHMHSRAGISIKYLGDEYMELVKACVKKAKAEGMYAYLYDEDRWPSGFGGGYVTKNKEYRRKILVLSENKADFVSKDIGIREARPYLLAVFDLFFDKSGRLISYKVIDEDADASGVKRYAYVTCPAESGAYNNQTYVDTLSGEAIEEFIRTTHEIYKTSVGEEFGNTVPAIFTDEPHIAPKSMPSFGVGHNDVSLPWTTDLEQIYSEKYNGEDIISKLPELVWDKSDGIYSQTKYRFNDLTCELFARNYADKIARWCCENSIALTGHVLCEPNVVSQSDWLGEAMRLYRNFTIPGIDMLCNGVELTTAKQAQSIKHQYGREAMMSELYGVTNWDFDFRGHKFQGDWQAALGVTLRVPHHSLVSLKGAAKRDFPASINYQSPWYKDYRYVEDHFARLNTVLTRGKPVVEVGVIHPIESTWISRGPDDTSGSINQNLEENFHNITRWLLGGLIDFDFISESLLPTQYGGAEHCLKVGAMEYKTIIVPECITIRQTTVDILKAFKKNGGRVVFVGRCPQYVDGEKSDKAQCLYDMCEKVNMNKFEILNSLQAEQTVRIINDRGGTMYNFIHCIRQDGDRKWLFVAHLDEDSRKDNICEDNITIVLNGEYIPTFYNTIDAQICKMNYETKDGKTYINKRVYPQDSLLIELKDGHGKNSDEEITENPDMVVSFKQKVEYIREEDNVFVLDMARYALDNLPMNEPEELTIIDDICRKQLGFPKADGEDAQPWVLGDETIEHYVTLEFEVLSKCKLKHICIAAEELESINVNGNETELICTGYYVDESIKKYEIGELNEGINIITAKVPISARISLENLFLSGDFNVTVCGCEKYLDKPSKKIGFSDITSQGMPFYGGNISYITKIKTPDCMLGVCTHKYRGAAVKIYLDGKEKGIIAYSPYILDIPDVKSGEHILEFKLLGNRMNTFGALHRNDFNTWYGPNMWYTYQTMSQTEKDKGFSFSTKWSYEYELKETGILSSPVVFIKNKKG